MMRREKIVNEFVESPRLVTDFFAQPGGLEHNVQAEDEDNAEQWRRDAVVEPDTDRERRDERRMGARHPAGVEESFQAEPPGPKERDDNLYELGEKTARQRGDSDRVEHVTVLGRTMTIVRSGAAVVNTLYTD
jgi:hypothetical protein